LLKHKGYEVVAVTSSEGLLEMLGQIEHKHLLLFVSQTVGPNGREVSRSTAKQYGIPIYELQAGIDPDKWLEVISRLLLGQS
jgi:hypothetical protein